MEGFESYEYKAHISFLRYNFSSEGPNGRISKMVKFTLIAKDNYQISFGDLNTATDQINDQSVSNNSDMAKVIFTVAKIIYEFTGLFPEAKLFFIGSTRSRTRLYQMMINKHKHLIQGFFEIVGCQNGRDETFNSKNNYDSFTAYRKL
jgi:hypothetical protein